MELLRKAAGHSQEDLAARLGMSVHQFGEYERGKVIKPDAAVYLAAAQILGQDTSVMFSVLGSKQSDLDDIVAVMVANLPDAKREDARRIIQALQTALNGV